MSDVTIKTLEWERTPSCSEIGHDPYDSATGFGGHYIVEERKAGHFDLWLPEQSVGTRHASAEAAKAAAQDDYEARILSCLDRRAPAAPATPPRDDLRAVMSQVRFLALEARPSGYNRALERIAILSTAALRDAGGTDGAARSNGDPYDVGPQRIPDYE